MQVLGCSGSLYLTTKLIAFPVSFHKRKFLLPGNRIDPSEEGSKAKGYITIINVGPVPPSLILSHSHLLQNFYDHLFLGKPTGLHP